MSLSICYNNYLNDIRYQLNNILIYDFEFIKDIEESIYECIQLIDQFCKEEDINYLINKINLLINNLNLNNDYIKQIF